LPEFCQGRCASAVADGLAATLDRTPATARGLRIGAEQERLVEDTDARAWAFFSGRLAGRSGAWLTCAATFPDLKASRMDSCCVVPIGKRCVPYVPRGERVTGTSRFDHRVGPFPAQ